MIPRYSKSIARILILETNEDLREEALLELVGRNSLLTIICASYCSSVSCVNDVHQKYDVHLQVTYCT
jgi:hypothetical protein